MKLSSSAEKATYPCLKRIYRVIEEKGGMFDLIMLDDEEVMIGEEIIVGTVKNKDEGRFVVKGIRLLN